MATKKKSVKKKIKKTTKKSVSSLRKDLTIQFMPYSEIAKLETLERIKKVMGVVLKNKIVILQGKLRPEEEVRLIENSMTLIGNLPDFQGIEIATISGDNDSQGLFNKIRHNIARILVGEQDAITIIGPATIVKDIKQDPKKIELMLQRR